MTSDEQREAARLWAMEAEIERRESRMLIPAAMTDGGGDGGGSYTMLLAQRVNEYARSDADLVRLKEQAAALRRELGPLARRPSLVERLRRRFRQTS